MLALPITSGDLGKGPGVQAGGWGPGLGPSRHPPAAVQGTWEAHTGGKDSPGDTTRRMALRKMTLEDSKVPHQYKPESFRLSAAMVTVKDPNRG